MIRFFVAAPYVCALLPFVVLATLGAPLGHDLYFELVRVAAYAHAWQDGQLPPYWGGDLYAGYGSPIFLFYGHVYLAIASVLAAVSHGYALGSVLALACITAFGVWAMLRAGSRVSPNGGAAVAARVAAYAFLLNPYLFGDALLRNANAEYTALCALPLVVTGVLRCADGEPAGVPWLTAGLALVFSAHLLSAGITCVLLALLAVFLVPATPNPRLFCARLGIGFGVALLLSAFLWVPVLFYGSSIRTQDVLTGKFDYRQNFVPWSELFSTDSFQHAGFAPLLALGAAIVLVVRERSRLSKRTLSLLFAFGTAVIALLVLQTAASAPVWELLVVAKYLQFPWRLAGPLAFSSALLAAIVVDHVTQHAAVRRRWITEAVILTLCLIGALSSLRQVRVLDRTRIASFEQSLQRGRLSAQPRSATVGHEYLPRVVRPELAAIAAAQRSALFNDPGTRAQTSIDEPRHLVVTVEATRAQAICLARWGFDFWKLSIDDQPVARIATKLGCLGVRVPAGTHRIDARLSTPFARRLGLALSALGVCIVSWWYVTRRVRMDIVPRRMTAKIEGDFVVFLIGARLNRWWHLGDFKWVGDAMRGMIQELEKRPESGFLGCESWVSLSPVMIQYWRSSEQLIAYARSRDATHYPVWVRFNKQLAQRRSVGIWHETFLVPAGNYECVYNNMPRFGLGRVATALEASGHSASAAGRLGRTDGTDAPVSADGLEK